MVSNLYFASNTILSCFFLFFLSIDLVFSVTGVIAQIYDPIAEFVIPIVTPANEEKIEIETQSVVIEIKISKCSM